MPHHARYAGAWMRLLDRYLLRELLIPLGYCLSGFLIFYLAFDLLTELDKFQRSQLGLAQVAQYYFARLPELLVVILPVALLLALLYSLTNHARHHEITAIRAAGVTLWRLSVPYLAVGAVFSLALLAFAELVLPDGPGKADELVNQNSARVIQRPDGKWHSNLSFHNDAENRDWHIKEFNLATFEMRKPQVDWHLADGMRRLLIAERAAWTNDAWTFFEVQEFRDSIPSRTNELTLAELTETPEQIKSEIKVSSLSSLSAAKKVQLTIPEILNYKRLHPKSDRNRALLDTQLHTRLAGYWTCLVVVLIALPFGAASGRRNVFVGVAASIFICFGYFVAQRLGLALGTGGYLPAWLAGWLPNLLFGITGAWLTQRVR
ncbi:MAG: LptF/LptG family permease [Verrucomicrobia bacterium]|nr:LptF/LptG family permease [Verrucomicrobiota bacterium]